MDVALWSQPLRSIMQEDEKWATEWVQGQTEKMSSYLVLKSIKQTRMELTSRAYAQLT